MAKLVNKQFNSPIGLYSEQNIKEVIERESQILSNGAVGVNFQNPSVGKPANLQNSAVLRMLEEEESWRNSGHATVGGKRVTWPPPNEDHVPIRQQQNNSPFQGGSHVISNGSAPNQQQPSQLASPSPVGYRPATPNRQWAPVQSPTNVHQGPPSYQQQQSYQRQPSYQQQLSYQQQPTYNQQQPSYQQQRSYQQSPTGFQTQQPYQSQPAPYQQQQQQQQTSLYQNSYQQQPQPQAYQYQQQPSQNNFVPQQQQQQPYSQQSQPLASQNNFVQQPYSPQPQQYQQTQLSAPSGTQAVHQPSPIRQVEPPPTTITLRQQAPISQAPPPVVTSQPATATLKGGKHLRGDLKWPPENVRKQVEEENQQRLALARGPAFRPRLVRKDYGPFFAQHALNASYPGYKVPPGTQFYEHRAV